MSLDDAMRRADAIERSARKRSADVLRKRDRRRKAQRSFLNWNATTKPTPRCAD